MAGLGESPVGCARVRCPRGAWAMKLALLVQAALIGGCAHDWDAYDPRGSAAGPGSGGAGVSAATSGAGGGGGGSSVTTSGTGAGGSMPLGSIDYPAAVAACINPFVPDPVQCENATGAGTMNVDSSDSTTGQPNISFLRFELDGSLSGRSIEAVELRLVVADTPKASGTRSGEVWEVQAFTYDDLFVGAPAQIGQLELAGDQGAVSQGQVVTWTLPQALVSPGASIFLGVYPLSSDGVDYWTLTGAVPPQLHVVYQ